MHVSRRQLLGFGSLLAAVPVVGRLLRPHKSLATTSTARPIKLRILSTTDLHCYLAPYDYYRDQSSNRVGLARLAGLIAAARAAAPNTLLFDNGDLIQGNPLGDYMVREHGLKPGQIHPVYKAMNLLGYDAATLGNHDFNYGLDYLARALAGAAFPYVSANVFDAAKGTPYFNQTVILNRAVTDEAGITHTIKVGVIGLVTPQIVVWDKGHLDGKITTADIVDTAAKLVPPLRAAGADLVVALCHSGFGHPPREKGDENAAWALSQVAGIDVLIAGHSHRVFPDIYFGNLPQLDLPRGTLNGIPATMAGAYGSHLGVIDLTLHPSGNSYAVAAASAAAWPLHSAPAGARADIESEIERAIAPEHHATLAYIREPVGTLTAPATTYFALAGDSTALGLVAAAQLWAVQEALLNDPQALGKAAALPLLSAVAPFKAGGRGGAANYTDIPAGQIAIRNIADLYLFPNFLEVVRIDGAGLRAWLEMSATIFRTIEAGNPREQNLLEPRVPGHDFDVIFGVTYRIDVGVPPRYKHGGAVIAPASHRIVDLCYQGQPVRDDDQFLVITSNYRANGGGSFAGLDGSQTIYTSPDPVQELIVAWVRAQAVIGVSDPGPWRFAPLPPGARVVFETAATATDHIPPGSGIAYLAAATDGFAKFSLNT